MDKKETIQDLATPFRGEAGGLISALRAVQAVHGCIPQSADAILADLFNLSRAEVRGVISFYTDFSREAKGDTVVRVCAAEACQAAGGRAIAAAAEKVCGVKMDETSASGQVSLEPVYCLGLCSVAPAAMVGEKLLGRASEEKLERALADALAENAS